MLACVTHTSTSVVMLRVSFYHSDIGTSCVCFKDPY